MLLVLILFRLLLGIRVSYTPSYVFLLILLAFCRISRRFFKRCGRGDFLSEDLGLLSYYPFVAAECFSKARDKWKIWGEEGALFSFQIFFFLKKSETPLNSEKDFTLDAGKRN